VARALPHPGLSRQIDDLTDLPPNARHTGATVRKRILLVEDDPHSRNGLQASLLAEGHGVEAVSDGWQGFQKIREGVFDLAIVDLDLPPVQGVVVTGWDVVRILRAYAPEIPVIMVSAQEDAGIQRLVKRFKVSAFMVKPIDPAGVKAFVRGLDHQTASVGVVDCSVC
jgi:DNA-binding response OmpR family regulator